MQLGSLGKDFEDGAIVVKQGEIGDCMYIVQSGQLDVLVDMPAGETVLSTLQPGDVFGEMALFTRKPRSATIRAKGDARVMTIDKRGFFKRVQEDPSLAFQILQKMSERIQHLDELVAQYRSHGDF